MTIRGLRRAASGLAALTAAAALAVAGVPSAAAQEYGYPDLQVSAAFDKPAYESGDVIRVTVTIVNVGTAAAEDVYAFNDWQRNSLNLDYPGWGDLDYGGPVARIEPGGTLVVELTGTSFNPSSGQVTFAADVNASFYDHNRIELTAPVTLTYGDFGGTVIDDKNGNGLADPGEGIGGVRVFMNGGVPYGFYEQTTDVHGRFFFDDLPTGRYFSSYYSEDGWVVGPEYPNEDRWVIGRQGVLGVTVTAVRPLSDKLLVTAEFEHDTYQVGEVAHVALTLRNKTGTTLTGIHAHCNGIGDSNQFNGVGPGWAAFDQNGPGVTLAAGETRTFDVYEEVPAGALDFGWVGLGCEIGPGAGTGFRGLPMVDARAKVPGLTTTASVRIIYDADGDGWVEDGEGIADTRVVLLDYGTHDVVARATSDADGRFEFAGIPTGVYVLRVVGPWQPAGSQSMILQAYSWSEGFEQVFGMEPRGSR